MATLEKRLQALEQVSKSRNGKPLPYVVDDDTTDAELGRLQALGLDPIRFTDAVELFI